MFPHPHPPLISLFDKSICHQLDLRDTICWLRQRVEIGPRGEIPFQIHVYIQWFQFCKTQFIWMHVRLMFNEIFSTKNKDNASKGQFTVLTTWDQAEDPRAPESPRPPGSGPDVSGSERRDPGTETLEFSHTDPHLQDVARLLGDSGSAQAETHHKHQIWTKCLG